MSYYFFKNFPFSDCFKSVVNFGIALGARFKACSAYGGCCSIHSAATYVTPITSVIIEAE